MAPERGPRLARRLSLALLVLYGVGTMVGGGFYALVGEVVAQAGALAPVSALLAGGIALASALSFAELASRFPVSAGESQYVDAAFGRRWLSIAVGVLVVATGVVSTATLANAIVGFVQSHLGVQRELGIVLVVAFLGGLCAWGIGQSVAVAVAITVVEVGGLVFVLFAAGGGGGEPLPLAELVPGAGADVWAGVALGGFTFFYAFVGFEDMVNVAEEVRRPRRDLPRAIVIALLATTTLYVLVTVAVVRAVPLERLAESRAPLAEAVASRGEGARLAIVGVSVLAGLNGAIVQVVMASRVAYGMADQGRAPRWLAAVHPATRTPVRATVLTAAIVLALALWFPLATLAQATSSILLLVFVAVNLALLAVRRRDPDPGGEGPRWPAWVPALGAALSAGFLAFRALA